MEGVGADAGPASAVAAEIVAAGGVAVADHSDVSTTGGAQALVDAAVERFGRIDVLVNNAGIIRWAGLPEADADNLARALRRARRRLVQHDARGVAAHGRAGLRPHRDDDVDGDVRTAEQPRPTRPRRAGVIGLTRSLMTEGAAHGIKVNAIAPAAMHAHGGPVAAGPTSDRPSTMAPELVAPMVAFLAHEDCPVSGEIYAAGGGRFARIFIASTRRLRPAGRRSRRSKTSPQHWATINDETGYYVPADLMAWSAAFMSRRQHLAAVPAADRCRSRCPERRRRRPGSR